MIFVDTCDCWLKLNYLMNIMYLLISFPVVYTAQCCTKGPKVVDY